MPAVSAAQERLRSMLRAVLTPMAWRVVEDTGFWLREENRLTGQRRMHHYRQKVFSPWTGEYLRPGDLIAGPDRRWTMV